MTATTSSTLHSDDNYGHGDGINTLPSHQPLPLSPCLFGDQGEDAFSSGECSPLTSWLDLNPMDTSANIDTSTHFVSTETSDRSFTPSEEPVLLPDWAVATISSVLQDEKLQSLDEKNEVTVDTHPSPLNVLSSEILDIGDDDYNRNNSKSTAYDIATTASLTMRHKLSPSPLQVSTCQGLNHSTTEQKIYTSHFDQPTFTRTVSTECNTPCNATATIITTTTATDGIASVLQKRSLPASEAFLKHCPTASPPAIFSDALFIPNTTDDIDEASSATDLGLASLLQVDSQKSINTDARSNTSRLNVQNHNDNKTTLTPHTPPLFDIPMDPRAISSKSTANDAIVATTQALFAALPIDDPGAAMTAANAMALMAGLPLLFSPQQIRKASPSFPMSPTMGTGLHTPTGSTSPPASSASVMPPIPVMSQAGHGSPNYYHRSAPMGIPNSMIHPMNMSIPNAAYSPMPFATTAAPFLGQIPASAPALSLSSQSKSLPVYAKSVPSIHRPLPTRLQLNNTNSSYAGNSPLLTPTEDSFTNLPDQSNHGCVNTRKRLRDDTDEQQSRPSPASRAIIPTISMTTPALSSNTLPLIAPATSEHPTTSNQSLDDQRPRRQRPRFPGDMYTPSWVRYAGQSKEGCCEDCKPNKWLQLKNSAYWYHKQFYHGISSVSGRPFIAPLETRVRDRDMIEGLCHQCRAWVPVASHRRRNCVLWYRHAHKCHVYQRPRIVTANAITSDVEDQPQQQPQPQQPLAPAPAPSQQLLNHYPMSSLVLSSSVDMPTVIATNPAASSLQLY